MINETTKREKILIIMVVFAFTIVLGLYLNVRVIIDNGGKMPVYDFGEDREEYFSYTNKEEVKHWYLSDYLNIPLPKNYRIWFSLGDILIMLSLIGTSICLILYERERKGGIKNENILPKM